MHSYIKLLYELMLYSNYNIKLIDDNPLIVTHLIECFSAYNEKIDLTLINLFIRAVTCAKVKTALLRTYNKFLGIICNYANIEGSKISKRAIVLLNKFIYLLNPDDINLLRIMSYEELVIIYHVKNLSIYTVVLRVFIIYILGN